MDLTALKPYLPSIGMVVAATLGTVATALTDNKITASELLQVALMALGAVTTYIVPRAERAQWLKPVVALLYAAINAAVSFMTDGISAQEWVLIALAALGALGVAATNKEVPVTPSGRLAPAE